MFTKEIDNKKGQSSVIGFFIGAMVAVIVALQAFKSIIITFGVIGGVSYMACSRRSFEHWDNYQQHV